MTETNWQPVVDAVAATLGDFDEVIRQVGLAIRARVSEYALVSDDELRAATSRNIRDLLAALGERRLLAPAELAHFTATVEQRARNGVPIDDYLLAVATAEGAMWDQLCLRTPNLPAEQRAEATALRLSCMNAITRVTASAHRRIELATARHDQERRAQALRALLRGGLTAEETKEQLARLELGDENPHFVVRARMRDPGDVRRLVTLPSVSGHAAYVLSGEDILGMTRNAPGPSMGFVIGISGPVPAAALPVAAQEAAIVFETAWALGVEGVSDLQSLGLKAAVQALPDIGKQLRNRYLTPLRESGQLGDELLGTVRAFLEAGSRREAAAERMHVHGNTIGYRLSRFCALTDTDLGDLTTIAELQWLFTDLDLRG